MARAALNKRSVGARYEAEAVSFLRLNGYDILGRNYRTRYGEIDIIAMDSDALCFIEVKYRRRLGYGSPAESVNRRKQLSIIRVSRSYIDEMDLYGCKCRFDVVEILGNRIRVIKDCFAL